MIHLDSVKLRWTFEMDAITPVKSVPKELRFCLKQNFGFSNFRKMQWNIIRSMLTSKRDHCLYAASASGKSLCYQFPSVYLDTVTLVIMPFISQMQDQVRTLKAMNIRACFLGSANPNKNTVNEVIDNEYNVVYVTPEFITSEVGEHLLDGIADFLTMIAVDEAHFVCEWSDGFRPAYGWLGEMRMRCPEVPILALTSTATERTKYEIIEILSLRRPKIYSYPTDRENIFYYVRSMHGSYNFWYFCEKPMIVFCRTANDVNSLAEEIESCGFDCKPYHSYHSLKYRKYVQHGFQKDLFDIVVTTICGLGITKPNVRTVVHYNSATDLDRYYREVGVAGRDGLPANSLIYYDECFDSDMREYQETNYCRRQLLRSNFDEKYNKFWPLPRDCCDNC